MKSNITHSSHTQDGITLLVTLLLMGVLLGVSTALLNVTLKQFQFSGFAVSSEMAFQAANAGMECALYQDLVGNKFNQVLDGIPVPNRVGIKCFGEVVDTLDDYFADSGVISGTEQKFTFPWKLTDTSPEICSQISVYKFYSATAPEPVIVNGQPMRYGSDGVTPADCPIGSECTVIQTRGYNVGCGAITDGGQVVEREYTRVY